MTVLAHAAHGAWTAVVVVVPIIVAVVVAGLVARAR